MNWYFDDESQKIIINAKKEMYELKHPYVGTEHLFLAVLKDNKLDITKFLKKYNITYKLFYNELVKTIGLGSKTSEWFLFTPMLNRVINNAHFYSSNSFVTPTSLIISLFHEGDGIANRILLSLKVDVDYLYEKFVGELENMRLEIPATLDELAINMNKQSIKKEAIYGREEEINSIIQILIRKNKNNPLLIGAPGVGKTAIIEELARRISLGEVPYQIKDKIIYNLPMSTLIAGTKYRGEFEERLEKIIKEVKNNPNIIIFIDEIHTIVGAGGAEGAIDASNILKPYIARNDLKIIGATTTNEYYKSIEKDKALARRFNIIMIEEPNNQALKKIMLKIKKSYENFYHVSISNKIIDEIIYISNEFLFYSKQPDKAIDLLDDVCAYSILNNRREKELNELDIELEKITREKDKEIKKHNLEGAKLLKEKEIYLLNNINKTKVLNSKKRLNISKKEIYDVLYLRRKVPIIKKDYKKILSELKKDYSNKQKIITEIVKGIDSINYLEQNRPFTFLLNNFFDEDEKIIEDIVSKLFDFNLLIKIDLKDYSFDHSLSKIINSVDNKFLIEIKNHSFSVILVKNIDKCHNCIFNYFMSAIKEGYFQDINNDKYYISKSIVFFTSNITDKSIGFNKGKSIGFKNYSNIKNIIKMNSFNN